MRCFRCMLWLPTSYLGILVILTGTYLMLVKLVECRLFGPMATWIPRHPSGLQNGLRLGVLMDCIRCQCVGGCRQALFSRWPIDAWVSDRYAVLQAGPIMS